MSRTPGNSPVGTSLKDLLLMKQALPPSAERSDSETAALKGRIAALEKENLALRERPSQWFAMAVSALREERFIDALGLLQAVLLCDPNHIRARINMAVVLAELGRPDRAAETLRQVLEQEPDNPTALRNLALLAEGS